MSISETVERIENAKFDAFLIGFYRCVFALAVILELTTLSAKTMRMYSENVVRVPFFSWHPFDSLYGASALGLTAMLAAFSLAIGFRSQLSAGLLTLSLGSFMLLDQQLYSNHLYLILLIAGLLSFTNTGKMFSLDSGRWAKEEQPVFVDGCSIQLIKIQLSLAYFYGAISKINESFLSGKMLEHLFVHESSWKFLATTEVLSVLSLLAAATILIELFLTFALWFKRSRLLAALLGAGFHLSLTLVMYVPHSNPLMVFTLVMLSTYILFFADRICAHE